MHGKSCCVISGPHSVTDVAVVDEYSKLNLSFLLFISIASSPCRSLLRTQDRATQLWCVCT